MCHYSGKIKKTEQKLIPSPFRLVSEKTVNYKTWYLFMDCVTTRLQMEIEMVFLSLIYPE